MITIISNDQLMEERVGNKKVTIKLMVLITILIKVSHIYQYKNIDINYDLNRDIEFDSQNSYINCDMKLRIIFLIIMIIVVNNNNNSPSYDDKLINENTNDSYN